MFSFISVLQTVAGSGKVNIKHLVNHTGSVTFVASTDRTELARNRCVIERFCGVFVLLYLCSVCRLGIL